METTTTLLNCYFTRPRQQPPPRHPYTHPYIGHVLLLAQRTSFVHSRRWGKEFNRPRNPRHNSPCVVHPAGDTRDSSKCGRWRWRWMDGWISVRRGVVPIKSQYVTQAQIRDSSNRSVVSFVAMYVDMRWMDGRDGWIGNPSLINSGPSSPTFSFSILNSLPHSLTLVLWSCEFIIYQRVTMTTMTVSLLNLIDNVLANIKIYI